MNVLIPTAQDSSALDPRLKTVLSAMRPLTSEEEDILRRATHRYQAALQVIREEAKKPSPDAQVITRCANEALRTIPSSERPRGRDMSVQRCQQIVKDCFADLSRIASADDAVSVARSVRRSALFGR